MTREDIQREINAAAEAGGGEVVLPAGTHMLDGALHLKNGVTLRGASEQTLLVTDDKEVNFIVLDPGPDPGGPAAQNVKISDLFLKGPGTDLDDITQDVSSSPVQGCGILASARQKPGVEEVVQNIVIERCRIENMSGCGIRFDTREDVLMKDITVRQCRLHQNRRAPDPPPPPGSGLPAPDSYKDIYFYGRRFENITLEGNTCTFTPTAKSAYGNDSGIAFVMNLQRKKSFGAYPQPYGFQRGSPESPGEAITPCGKGIP